MLTLVYNQIKLKVEDEEKTDFITLMEFFVTRSCTLVSKNAGATYQHMMQNCLRRRIGRNVQVYIGDMVITTRDEATLIDDL
jgi:hypothetical protein